MARRYGWPPVSSQVGDKVEISRIDVFDANGGLVESFTLDPKAVLKPGDTYILNFAWNGPKKP